ncbi:MAG TPA: hypothetical protein PLI90_07625 [Rhodocyclaceae bacterium]|nr:hypothetical protein [Rhodocyclaceae bacterium]
MKGCVLAGRYVFFNGDEKSSDEKNERLRRKRARIEGEGPATEGDPEGKSITPDCP